MKNDDDLIISLYEAMAMAMAMAVSDYRSR